MNLKNGLTSLPKSRTLPSSPNLTNKSPASFMQNVNLNEMYTLPKYYNISSIISSGPKNKASFLSQLDGA